MIDYIAKIIVGILILILIITLLNIFPKFILFIIIILFIALFIINLIELINYTNRYVITKKEGEGLKSYCTLDKYKLFNSYILFDTGNFTLFVIYLILFILFWSNKIANDISSNSLNSEIKILGFYKHYNKDIYKNYNYEYECIYAIMLFIALSTVIYGLNLIYYNFLGLNKKENDVIENINTITNLLKDNINYSYLDYYISDELDNAKKASVSNHVDLFKNYIDYINAHSNDNAKIKESLELYNTNPSEFYLKSHITYKLFEFERREKKDGELIKNIFESSNYCIFDLLSGKDIEDMFPSTINYVHPIYNNIFIKKEVNKEKILTNYKIFIDALKNNYSNVKAYEKVNIFYYKLDLLFTKFSGVLFSIFAIVFFIKTEFKQIFKNFLNINIDPLEYTIDKYNNIFKIILIVLSLLFISILFNS